MFRRTIKTKQCKQHQKSLSDQLVTVRNVLALIPILFWKSSVAFPLVLSKFLTVLIGCPALMCFTCVSLSLLAVCFWVRVILMIVSSSRYASCVWSLCVLTTELCLLILPAFCGTGPFVAWKTLSFGFWSVHLWVCTTVLDNHRTMDAPGRSVWMSVVRTAVLKRSILYWHCVIETK